MRELLERLEGDGDGSWFTWKSWKRAAPQRKSWDAPFEPKVLPHARVRYRVEGPGGSGYLTSTAVAGPDDEFLGSVVGQRVPDAARAKCARQLEALIAKGYGPWEALGDDVVAYEVSSAHMASSDAEGTTSKVGKQLYLKLVAALRKRHPQGFFLMSNRCGSGRGTSGSAARVWASLAKRYPGASGVDEKPLRGGRVRRVEGPATGLHVSFIGPARART